MAESDSFVDISLGIMHHWSPAVRKRPSRVQDDRDDATCCRCDKSHICSKRAGYERRAIPESRVSLSTEEQLDVVHEVVRCQ
jgi:hypothetical protein